jgi:quinoprotein relay system zinc metallohydrolase 2
MSALRPHTTNLPQHEAGAAGVTRRHACGCILSMLCCGTALQAQATVLAADTVELVEVAPGLHVFRGAHEEATAGNLGAIANIAVLIGQETVAIVDTGGSFGWGNRFRAAIRSLTELPIRYVINSHVHPDHILGNAAFEADGPEIIGHAKLPDALAARGSYYLEHVTALLGTAAVGTRIVGPTMLVNDRQEIDLGDRVLRLRAHSTAHTDHDLSVFDTATNTLLASDLLFMDRIPVIDGSLNGWLEVLNELRRLPADRVIPGHGPASAPWPDALDDEERYLRTMQSDIRALIAAGGTIEQAVETAGRSERGSWLLFDDYHARNIVTAFAELEWE